MTLKISELKVERPYDRSDSDSLPAQVGIKYSSCSDGYREVGGGTRGGGRRPQIAAISEQNNASMILWRPSYDEIEMYFWGYILGIDINR